VLVLVCAYCSACTDLCDSGPESIRVHRGCRSSRSEFSIALSQPTPIEGVTGWGQYLLVSVDLLN